MTDATSPELLPARMLNEFVYCPRLFYLEWVDARWSDNDDTEAGKFVHRTVDRGGGHVPDPDDAADLKSARRVRVENASLGVLAVIDRVDGDDGAAVPVEFKKGHPQPDGSPWPADRTQVLVQAVLLREEGYPVREAIVYYAETRLRVRVPIAEAAAEEVVALVTRARAVAEALHPPLPLVDSPKCPRCSLVGLCLPDETNALLARAQQPPRRIVPRDPAPRPMYVTEQGATVGVRGGRITVAVKGEKRASVRVIDISQLNVHGHVQVTTEALTRLWSTGTPVMWFSYGGWLRAWAQGEPSRYVELRRRQVGVHAQGGLGLARPMIAGKIRNSRTMLRRNSRTGVPEPLLSSLKQLEQDARTARSTPQLLGIEGTAARLYFQHFTRMMADPRADFAAAFDTEGRSRRPPPDPVNCMLSYVYALLLKDLVAVCLGVGLDPFLGVLHGPRFGRPSLALDLAEEFRPLVADSAVIGLVNNGEVRPSSFVVRGRGAALTTEGRRSVIAGYERRLDVKVTHPVFGYKVSYRRVLDIQARLLAAVMVGELPEYVPMTTR